MVKSVRKNTRSYPLDPFDDRVDMLFDELELAVKWNRPSILLAVYKSEFVRADIERVLNKRLADIAIKIVHLQVSENQYDIPLELIKQHDLEKTIFFISGLAWGGGKSGGNAYRALNIRREYLVDYKIRAIFWITEKEAIELPFRAPDFWAFRHRVFEFIDKPSALFSTPISQTQPVKKTIPQSDEIIEKIESRENLLAQLPDNKETNADRLDILLRLGNLYWMNGELEKARGLLSSACVLARSIGSRDMQFRACMGLGGVTYGLGVLEESTSAYQQAIKIDPTSFIPWLNLSIIYSKLGKTRRSIYAAKKATALNPHNAEVWFTLGDIYFAKGRFTEALPAYKNSLALDKKNACIWKKLGDVYQKIDQIPEAISAFEKSARLSPTDVDTLSRLSILYRNSGEIQMALKLAEKTVKKDPTANNWIVLGSIFGVQERYLDAISAYFQAVSLNAPTPLAEISLAYCFLKIGNTDQFVHWRSLAAARLTTVDDYAAACFYAIAEDSRAALKALRIAIRKKLVSTHWLSQDPLFVAIRQDKRFQKLLQTQSAQ